MEGGDELSVLADRVEVRAVNHPDEWGSSDHCQVKIDVSI
jgi:hypothetical protein